MLVIKAAQARPHTDDQIADAVLDALMEPTKGMMENEDEISLSCWRAMIQAARKEK